MRKAVLITGASGGIGHAIACQFAAKGYDIIATYNKHQISDDLRLLCEKQKVCLYDFQLDITKSKQVEEVFDAAFRKVGYIDCIVCNSGISLGEKMLCDNNDEEIANLIETNLIGTIYCNREAEKHLLAQNYGNIINISSIYGVNGGSCEAVYSASKAGVIGLTKALSQELQSSCVRVNAVAPGFVETAMTAGFSAEEKEEYKKENNLQRLTQPEDVARVVYEIAEKNSSINGEVVFVD